MTAPATLRSVEDALAASTLEASGAWTVDNAAALEHAIEKIASKPFANAHAVLDVKNVIRLDTFGAWLIERLRRLTEQQGLLFILKGLDERYGDLLQQVGRTNRDQPARPRGRFDITGHVTAIGLASSSLAASGRHLGAMLGALALALVRQCTRPWSFRWTSAIYQLDRVGLRAVPIILLITFLIGAIIAQQGIFHFRKFGADDYVVDLVGILILREIGVLLVAIMVAGRSGSSYTAELGSMKMREEIDALRTMGLDPVEVLLLPRVLALVCALPILAFLGSMAALYGGGLVAWFYGGMSPTIFIERLKEAISITHFQVGMIKAPFMALAIGVVACSEGLQVKGSAESLGLQTTTSVVKSIFLVIVLDGLFAIFFASIGM
jgi:phospholipid/cholesterol/gamma-HCH transport system permease protein